MYPQPFFCFSGRAGGLGECILQQGYGGWPEGEAACCSLSTGRKVVPREQTTGTNPQPVSRSLSM